MTLELTEMFIQVVGTSPVIQALAGGIIIALMNLFGASLILVWRIRLNRPSMVCLDSRPV